MKMCICLVIASTNSLGVFPSRLHFNRTRFSYLKWELRNSRIVNGKKELLGPFLWHICNAMKALY